MHNGSFYNGPMDNRAVSDRSAVRYHRLQLVLGVAGLALDAVVLGALAWMGGAHAMADVARRATSMWWIEVAAVAVGVGAASAVVGFPLAWLRGYHLPRQYGLLHQPIGAWLLDRAKAAALGGAFALVTVEVIYLLLRTSALWWLIAAAIVWGLSVVVATVFPVVIVPLFYRLTPLGDADLRARLLALAARAGVPAMDVFVVDHSRKSRTANAALAGIGRTRRIILFDTLVRDFTASEIEAVLAHELAHQVHRDLWRGLAAQAVITVASFWIAHQVLRATAAPLGLVTIADPAGLPWLALVIGAVGILALPVMNGLSRHMERQADGFAFRFADPEAFIGAMERLASINLAERRPSRLKEVLLHSHPALDRRIARARAAATRLECSSGRAVRLDPG